ncbi:MAG: transcriptional regulator [Pseudohongiellaceae bacterium]
MNIKVIHTEPDYEAALGRIEQLLDAVYGSEEGDELELLAALVELYESRAHQIESPDPVEFLKSAMMFSGKTQRDLAVLLNSRSRASELLNRKRSLTLENIRTISRNWGIPTDALVQEYATV